jgi:exopolysaccharide production protein ExoZ
MCGCGIAHFLGTRGQATPAWRHNLGLFLIVAGFAVVLSSAFAANPMRSRLLYWGLPGAVIVAGAVLSEARSRGVVNRVFVFLGTASYTIYLSHTLVMHVLKNIFQRPWFPDLNPDFLLVSLIAVTLASASMLYFVFERPLMRLSIGNLPLGRKKAVADPQAAAAE